MNIGLVFLGILLFLTSVFMILLILVQRGKGGGLTGALGGMGGQSAFGSKAGDVFTRITVVTAMIWITLCMITIAAYNPPTTNALAEENATSSIDSIEDENDDESIVDDSAAVGEGELDVADEEPSDIEAELENVLGENEASASDEDNVPNEEEITEPSEPEPATDEGPDMEGPEGSEDENSTEAGELSSLDAEDSSEASGESSDSDGN